MSHPSPHLVFWPYRIIRIVVTSIKAQFSANSNPTVRCRHQSNFDKDNDIRNHHQRFLISLAPPSPKLMKYSNHPSSLCMQTSIYITGRDVMEALRPCHSSTLGEKFEIPAFELFWHAGHAKDQSSVKKMGNSRLMPLSLN